MTKVMVVICLGFIAACMTLDYAVHGLGYQVVRAMMFPY